MSDQELADFYQLNTDLRMYNNEYLIIKDKDGKVVDKAFFCDGKKERVCRRIIKDNILDEIRPRNVEQELLFDLLYRDVPLVSISGEAGSGKTFVSLCYALQELNRGKYQKIILVRNDVCVKNVTPLGSLPGSDSEKMMASCMYVADIIGDYNFENLLAEEKIEIAYLGTMRSRSFSNSIILCNESQNLTKDLVKMMITRIGDNSKLIFDFDLSQVDKAIFDKDNGVFAMNESLKGNRLFGAIQLKEVERSEVAKLASLIK